MADQDNAVHLWERDGSSGQLFAIPHRPVWHHRQFWVGINLPECSLFLAFCSSWDTSASTVSKTQTHLVNQYYDICIRRTRGYCSICYTPAIISSTTGTGSSYGLGAGSDAMTQKSAIGSICTGITIVGGATPGTGYGVNMATLRPKILPFILFSGMATTSRSPTCCRVRLPQRLTLEMLSGKELY